ncbi:membrane protein UL45 [Falconid herpesvirus 1]|uniref:Membrane protein UL45 n=1 Tax=Falconid herpesvirus 1 TaxID=1510155 RepID=A0A068EP99_9ALPH|nr:membrane protein UL45 [Falconid herpesvirus 1]AID52751.1 membrane protein UL45 [Falconid herpesvirus 1]
MDDGPIVPYSPSPIIAEAAMMSPVPESELEPSPEPRITGELRVDAYPPCRDASDDSSLTKCARVCCGFVLGTLVTIVLAALVAFIVLIFAFSYTSLESGVCQAEWVGLDRLCLGVASRNASEYDANTICESAGAEVVSLGTIQSLIDVLSTFTRVGNIDFTGVARVGGNKIVCIDASSSGPTAIKCPDRVVVICQRARPLGVPAEIIRRVRVFLGLERQDYYDRLYNISPHAP